MKFQIKTVEMPNGDAISFCSERGIITSLKLGGGEEILYMNEETLHNSKTNIRGGIPVLFPNAGPVSNNPENNEFSKLKQHGFARNQKWDFIETMEGITTTLNANDETMKVFPYSFSLSLINRFGKDGSVTIIQQVENYEADKEMPLSMGLHPYFKVQSGQKKEIKFNFPGGDMVEKDFENWSNGGTTVIDNSGIPMEIHIPGLSKALVVEYSKEYQKICIWSEPGKNFICIEPFMRSDGGLADNPEMIKPYQKYSGITKIKFKE